MADFKLGRIRYKWKGAWVAGSDYIPDDIIEYHGKSYVCLVQHTSDADFYTDINFLNSDIPPAPEPKWLLMMDGYSWEGAWTPDTFYVKGNIVKYAGGIYLCVEPHTSASTEEGFETDVIANWAVHAPGDYWKNEWAPQTYYRLNDQVKYFGMIYRCIVPHTSADTYSLGIDADLTLNKWEIVSFAEQWNGDWTTSTRYRINDVVRYHGIVYRCLEGHISSGSTSSGLETDISKWSVVRAGIEYKNTWAATTRYHANDVVKYGADLWICTTSHTSDSTFNSGNWDLYTSGFEYEYTWSDATVYQPGDVVRYGGYLFVANSHNVNITPSQNSTVWSYLYLGTRIRGEWYVGTAYFVGDLVRRNGQLYVAVADGTGHDTDLSGDGSTINSDYWELVIPGEKWQGVWQPYTEYVIGDVVNWIAHTYRCVAIHTSGTLSRPDNDSINTYWVLYTFGTDSNRLKNLGDIKTYGYDAEASATRTKSLPIGTPGDILKAVNGEPAWSPLWESSKVYYVSTNGVDDSNHGTTLSSPWRTIRYACENVTGTSTIYVKHGTYNEVLPIRVPAFVSIVGDELRGVVVQPAPTLIPSTDVPKTIEALTYIAATLIQPVITNTPVSTLYSLTQQNVSGSAGSTTAAIAAEALVTTMQQIISTPATTVTIIGTNSATSTVGFLDAINKIEDNREFITQETLEYINTTYPSYSYNADTCARDIGLFIDAIKYDLLYTGNWKSVEAANYYANAADGARNAKQNMFLLRDGTGLRNMTLKGLSGEFTAADQYLIKRVTAGAFASLDPGWGPDDETAWVGTKSPYIQNVTNFGTKCVGLKVDGDLHNGGNQTIVANDFTQILSDGIGFWANGTGKSELVSVFTYYNYVGYLAENGGKVRSTNGNNSYGTYGCIAQGSALGESPITAAVNNQYYQAQISSTLIHEGSVMKLFYSNAGVNYSNATYTVAGSGVGAVLTGDEFRDNGVYEARVVDRGDSTALGGLGYLFNTNNTQQGDTEVIRLAASDTFTKADYEGMRIFLQEGTGAGQYAYVAAYDFVSKDLTVGDELFTPLSVTSTIGTSDYITVGSNATLSADMKVVLSGTAFGGLTYGQIYYVKDIVGLTQITLSETLGGGALNVTDGTGSMTLHKVGWRHINEGTTIQTTLDTTTVYYIEPRVQFSSPGFTTSAGTISSSSWKSTAYGNSIFVAVSTDTVATSTDGSSWTLGSIPAGAWKSVAYGNGRFVVVASSGTSALYSDDGLSWTSVTIPAGDYRSVVYGNAVSAWVTVSANTNKGAVSLDNGVTWTETTLSEGAEWNSVAFGNGKFVAVGLSDSTLTQTLYSTDGISWSTGSYIGGCEAVAFGNGRFVAIDGTSSTSSFTSLNGIDWTASTLPGSAASWKTITYGGGLFLATATGSAVAATSADGLNWTAQTLTASATWGSAAYGAGDFVVVGGSGAPSTATRIVSTGATTQARATVVSGKISTIDIWEPGSGYSATPVIYITDPNATAAVAIDVRKGSGVLANPTVTNAGLYYASIETTVTGDGYMDSFQIGKYLIIDSLTRVPRPGDNLFIGGIDGYTYRVLQADVLSGTVPNVTARLTIAKALNRAESPEHGTVITIRQGYSQVRITGHDFLDIGLGNFISTNYPNTLNPEGTVLAPENEFGEFGGGRIFYSSTDQDGNFRVGELFAVEQASGTVTLSADFFQLEGLEELQLGGISVGGTGTVIREFSTDEFFLADSNNIVPTQRAIKAYVSARVSGGGSDARTGTAISGLVSVGPTSITTTTGGQIDIPVPVKFTKGVDGVMLALAYFMDAMSAD